MHRKAYIQLGARDEVILLDDTLLESFASRKMLCVTEIDGNNGINDAWKNQCVGRKTVIIRKQIS